MIETGILDAIERWHTLDPDGVCFYLAGKPGIPGRPVYEAVTYDQLRRRAARLARAIDRMDVHRGMWCAADMENCSSFVYLLVAAAMGGFAIVVLNQRLTTLEKAERLQEMHAALCVDSLPVFDEQAVKEAIKEDTAFDRVEKMDVPRWVRRGMVGFSHGADALILFTSGATGRPKAAPLTWGNMIGAATASNAALNEQGRGLWQLALPLYRVGGMQIVMRSILNGNPFILYRTFDATQLLRDVDAYGATHVSVTDKMLRDMLSIDDAQARREKPASAFPEEHIEEDRFEPEEGLRDPLGLKGADIDRLAEESDDPFDAFDPFDGVAGVPCEEGPDASGCSDGEESGTPGGGAGARSSSRWQPSATLNTLVPDPIDADDPFEHDADEADAGWSIRPLARYQVILLDGVASNGVTLRRAVAAHARIFASFGMIETCSQVASRLVTSAYDGTLTPLPGYEVTVVAPDENGLGQLAVKGPGVVRDYLNAHARFTADGFFLTGESACMKGRCVRVAARTEDTFVSGGENIYPEEIRAKILQASGVTDAYVFGDENDEWGKRPVAVVEAADASREEGFNLQLMTDDIVLSLSNRLPRLYRPDCIVVVPEFPRTGVGKTDRRALRKLYEQRIDVRRVEIWCAKQPLVDVGHAVKPNLRERESLVVRVTDWAGRTGIGEDAVPSVDLSLTETANRDLSMLQDVLAPLVNDHVFVHPSQASVLFRTFADCRMRPLACAALEGALWDLYGKVTGRSIAKLIGGRDCVSEPGSLHAADPGCVPGGAVMSGTGKREVLARVREAVDAGYARVKLKARPGELAAARAVHEGFPDLTLVIDANQSFTEDDIDELKELDALGAACIEDPLDPTFRPKVGPQDFWTRLVRLQRDLSTPICLDESWTTADELKQALRVSPSLRCVALRLDKLGGVQPALEFYWWARERGIALWMGGAYDMGVLRRLQAAFATLPGMNVSSDLSDVSRSFAVEITTPAFALEHGMLRVNPAGYEYGLGCEVDELALDDISVERVIVD